MLILIIIVIVVYKFIEYKIIKPIYTLNVNTTILENVSKKLDNINRKIYNATNPSIFCSENIIYYTFRLTANHYFSFHKLKTLIKNNFADYPSRIGLSSNMTHSEIILSDIRENLEYQKLTKNKKYLHTGYEDSRAILLGNKLYLFVSLFACSEKYTQLGVISVSKHDLNQSNIYPKNFKLLIPSRNQNQYQKNWMPFIYNDNLYLVYSVNPHKILKCNPETGETVDFCITFDNNISTDLRGGGNIVIWDSIKYGSVYLGIVHTRRYMYYTQQIYIYQNKPPFEILAITDEFYFSKNHINFINSEKAKYFKYFWNIQFASGLLIHNNKLIICYGENNSKSIRVDFELSSLETKLYLI
jgi:hypothetical protein